MSTLRADTIQSTGGGAATLTKQSAAKMWAVVDANTATTALSKSFGVASVSDDGTGKYTLSFVSSMDGALYAVSGISNTEADDNTRTTAVFCSSANSATPSGATSSAVTLQNQYVQASSAGEFGYGYTGCIVQGDLA
jgi:hypothetical protein